MLPLLAIAVASACNSDAYVTTPQAARWDFIQSAGGIRVEQAQRRSASSWVLPVICDISGLKTITTKPTAMHSGAVVTEMHYEVSGDEISIAVVFAAPLETGRTSACQPITIASISPGEYRVVYRDGRAKHLLGIAAFK